MKNIKKFNSVEDLEESRLNLAPQEYYLDIYEEGQGTYFEYYLTNASNANFTGTTEGLFAEITPGVAYLDTQDNKNVLYNPKFEPIEVSGSNQTWTWEEFGMTMDLYNKYLASAKAYVHPSVFNIFVNGEMVREVEYTNVRSNMYVENLRFSKNCWGIVFDPINETVTVNNNCE